ncbi:MAG: hypothetical protein H0U16_01900, partial [Actinobacteria bacterium]|nr:hypothetical protein [Actinomycetota bacterium]
DVAIAIDHSAFDRSHLEFRAGDTVRFVIHNSDPIDHELIIGDTGVQAHHEEGTEPRHGAVPGEVSVPSGTTRTTTYTFEEPGRLLFGCHLPGHYRYGMKGSITITP